MDGKSCGNEICVLCCRETTIFAVGVCDHHVCHECSTKMRVLCQQNECPICRSDMPFVIFSRRKQPFSLSFSSKFSDKDYMIVFEDEDVQNAFYKLLEHKCPECKQPCDSFKILEKHVRREHGLNYCLVCADNLKLFSFERRCYNRKDFAHHNRKGDLDDKSHRGHPECDYCQKRFMDRDELFRHMRKEHFFCHFCDADLKHEFYEEYEDLRNHFRTAHFLCEEEECAKERFVSVFRTNIDLKAHKARKHMKNKTKAELKQTRTLGFEFPLAPRHAQNGDLSPESRRGRNQNRRKTVPDDSVRNSSNTSAVVQTDGKMPFNAIIDDFPSLLNEEQSLSKVTDANSYGYSSCLSSTLHYKQQPVRRKTNSLRHMSAEDFPALSGPTPKLAQSSSQSKGSTQKQTFVQQIKNSMASSKINNHANQNSKWRQNGKPLDMAEFPQLKSFDSFCTYQTQQSELNKTDKKKPTDESLAQQLYQKCKMQSKIAAESETHEPRLYPYRESSKPTKQDRNKQKDNGVDMSLMYGGLSKHNPLDVYGDIDPLQDRMDEIMLQKSAYSHRYIVEEETPWRIEAKLDLMDDFPPLESNNSQGPPGFDKPQKPNAFNSPPGFSKQSKQPVIKSNNHISLSSIAQQLNNSKLKTSQQSLESKINQPPYSYQEPVDFQERNNMLIFKIKELIGSDNKLFDEFKLLSGNFRKNKITASDYYSNCLKILGKDTFCQLFSELLCLLPDIQKQQELFSVHEQFSKEDKKPYGAVPKKNLSKARSYVPCSECMQILAKQDLTNHQLLHSNKINYLTR